MSAVFSSLTPSGASLSAVTTTVGTHGTLALGANLAQVNALTFIDGGDLTMTTGSLTLENYNGIIQSFVQPLVPTLPVSSSNPLSPSTALISGGTVVITGFTAGAIFPVIIQSSGGTLSAPSQSIALSAVTGGNFTLTFNSATTAPISFSTATATLASSIQSALNALTAFSATATASVAVSGTTATVTFLNVAAGALSFHN